jgi:3-methyladenine DNA glycosylase/8-oxoguanine DNA glycosylase
MPDPPAPPASPNPAAPPAPNDPPVSAVPPAPAPGLALAPAGPATQAEPLERLWQAPFVVDVRRVLAVHRRGHGDPAYAIDQTGAIWRACRTPDGPGTLRVIWQQPAAGPAARAAGPGPLVDAAAWGPGAAWLLAALPGLLGADDSPETFTPHHPLLRDLARRYPGVRIGRSGLVLEALVPAVLEQKVVGKEATRAWRALLRRFGSVAPGPAPAGMRVPPSASEWAAIPSWEWHLAGVEAVRARTIVAAARLATRIEEITTMPPDASDRRLRALPGIGPWTSAEVRQRACGDADAVSVGDYHLPAIVGWALAGRVVDDAGMLELLAPYHGHRHRAATWIGMAGLGPPRRGPRLPVRDYRSI